MAGSNDSDCTYVSIDPTVVVYAVQYVLATDQLLIYSLCVFLHFLLSFWFIIFIKIYKYFSSDSDRIQILKMVRSFSLFLLRFHTIHLPVTSSSVSSHSVIRPRPPINPSMFFFFLIRERRRNQTYEFHTQIGCGSRTLDMKLHMNPRNIQSGLHLFMSGLYGPQVAPAVYKPSGLLNTVGRVGCVHLQVMTRSKQASCFPARDIWAWADRCASVP